MNTDLQLQQVINKIKALVSITGLPFVLTQLDTDLYSVYQVSNFEASVGGNVATVEYNKLIGIDVTDFLKNEVGDVNLQLRVFENTFMAFLETEKLKGKLTVQLHKDIKYLKYSKA